MKIIGKTALEGFDAIKTNEIKNIRRKAMVIYYGNVLYILERKINIKRIWNNLDEFEMNELVAKLNADIEILRERKKQVNKNIKNIEKLKL